MLTLSPSWEGAQAVQALNPKWSVRNPQCGMSAGNADAHSKEGSTNPTLSQEEVWAGQALIPRQARVSVPAKVPLVLQWGNCFFPRQHSGCHWGKGLTPRRQAPWLPPQLGPSTLNQGLLGVPPGRGKTTQMIPVINGL